MIYLIDRQIFIKKYFILKMIYLINMQIYIKKNIFHSQNAISNKIAIIPNNLRRNNHRRSFL